MVQVHESLSSTHSYPKQALWVYFIPSKIIFLFLNFFNHLTQLRHFIMHKHDTIGRAIRLARYVLLVLFHNRVVPSLY
jgi:hypothetical protein